MTNEEIREQLQSLIDNSKSFIRADEDSGIWERDIEALTAAIETLDTCDWRRVADELPQIGESVLVIASGKPMPNIEWVNVPTIAEYWDALGWEISEYLEWGNAQVTHWMPLPELPKDIYDAETQKGTGENHDRPGTEN